MLAPSLVEGHPHHDRGMVEEPVDEAVELAPELHSVRLCGVVAVRHVLPHEQSEPVAPVVPARRLDLDMLARHVETHLLGDLDVVSESVVSGGGVESVRPETLVEEPDLKEWFIVEKEARTALVVLPETDMTHGEVAVHTVDFLAVRVFEDENQIVEHGSVGTPEFCLGHGQKELFFRIGVRFRAGRGASRGQTQAGQVSVDRGFDPQGESVHIGR